MPKLHITQVSINDLKPYEHNARVHSTKQLNKLANSIKTFGFNSPVLIDGDKQIIAGHGRVEAAKLAGLKIVPCVQVNHLSAKEKQAYIIADNRIAELATWDVDILSFELEQLMCSDLDFDVSVTGFELPEIDAITLDAQTEPANEPPSPAPPVSPVTQLGDLWQLGPHRIFCGDAQDPATYTTLLAGTKADVVFTDPPYNVPIPNNVTTKSKHKNFAMACGEMSNKEFEVWLGGVLEILTSHSRSGAVHFICMDWRHIQALLAAAAGVYGDYLNLCVWNKDNGGMGSLYRSKHELIALFRVGKRQHINNIQLGRYGRYRTNVWDYPGMSSLQAGRDALLDMHPTIKPVALIADALLDVSHRGDIVLDPFGGSGSTLLAAERCGRVAHLTEIDPAYVDVTISRYEAMTGNTAININENQTFAKTASNRTSIDEPKESKAHE